MKRGSNLHPHAPANHFDHQADRADDSEDRWRLSKDGKWMLKRDSRHIIHRPIEKVGDRPTQAISDWVDGGLCTDSWWIRVNKPLVMIRMATGSEIR